MDSRDQLGRHVRQTGDTRRLVCDLCGAEHDIYLLPVPSLEKVDEYAYRPAGVIWIDKACFRRYFNPRPQFADRIPEAAKEAVLKLLLGKLGLL